MTFLVPFPENDERPPHTREESREEYELFVRGLIQEYLRYFRVKEACSVAGEMWFGSQSINT